MPAIRKPKEQDNQRREQDVYVAKESFACEIDGERINVRKGKTRVRVGHPLLDAHAGYFEPVDRDVQYDVEKATAAPGEKRGE